MDNKLGAVILAISDFITRQNWLVKARLSYVEDKGARGLQTISTNFSGIWSQEMLHITKY
jgi:hypothetical protein